MTTSPERADEAVETEEPLTEAEVVADVNAGEADADEIGTDGEEADAPTIVTPARKRFWRRPAVVAAAVGVLGLVVGGAGGWGLSQLGGGDSSSSASAALKLPDTLSGGYKRNATVDAQISSSVKSAQKTLGAGTDMALYTKGQNQVLIQATRLPGQAILNAGMTYGVVGDAVCASTTSSSGTEAICTRTSDDLTVQVTATDSTTATKYVDEVYNALIPA